MNRLPEMRKNSQKEGIQIREETGKQTSITALHWILKLKVRFERVYSYIPVRHWMHLIQYTGKIPEVQREKVTYPWPHNLISSALSSVLCWATADSIKFEKGTARENVPCWRTITAFLQVNNVGYFIEFLSSTAAKCEKSPGKVSC